jgi:hypothetical protein
MVTEFTPGGLMSVGTPFERSKLGRDIRRRESTFVSGGGGGSQPAPAPAPAPVEVKKTVAVDTEKIRQQEEARQQRELLQRRTFQERSNERRYEVRLQPTIERRQTGTFTPKGTTKKIPVTETYYKPVYGAERKATAEERKYFEEQTSVVGKEATEKISQKEIFKDKLRGISYGSNEAVRQSITEPIAKISGATVGKAIGWKGFEDYKGGVQEVATKIKGKSSPESARYFAGQTYEFIGGVGGRGLQFFREKPLSAVGSVALGTAIGFGSSAVVTGATTYGGATAGTLTSLGIQAGGGVLAYGYGKNVLSQIKAQPDVYEKGGVFGKEATKITLVGAGASYGGKLFQQKAGAWRTRGREIVPLEKLTPQEVISGKKSFPTAPTSQHLQLFKSKVAGKYIDSGKPGAFHTTPGKFWKKTLTPEAGTSELPGLYGSSYISPHFAKITGSGSSGKISFSSAQGLPGIAYIKPKGFRSSPYKSTGKGYQFVKTPKPGYADIPGMKTEIEAIFRPEAGSYGFESGAKYTVIKNVKVPIDVFSYETPSGGVSVKTTGGATITGGASSYSYPSTSSIVISPETTAVSLSTSKVSKEYETTSIPSSSNKISTSSYVVSSSPKVSSPSFVSGSSRASPKSSVSSYSKIPSSISSVTSSSLKSSKSSYKSPSSSYYSRISRRSSPRYVPKQIGGIRLRPIRTKRTPATFGVQVRRFGRFRPIGGGLSIGKAISVGRQRVVGTLGATFKIVPEKKGSFTGGVRTPRGFRQKPGLTFIEIPKLRLSTKGETIEIGRARRKR